VVKGEVVIDFFASKKRLSSVNLKRGDSILLMDGVHRLRADAAFTGVKVKQGPYKGLEIDKVIIQ
jgi:hypothetical protein